MESSQSTGPKSESIPGVIYAVSAFLIWGLVPIYWKALVAVPPLEIILHRVVWSFTFLLILIIVGRRWNEFFNALKDLRILLTLFSTAVILGLNWWLYVWAINNDYMLQGSLGYYINPLVNVVFGVLFLRERLRPAQVLAVLLAGVGVVYLTISYGVFPWIALALASSFGLYGLIRKVAPVGPLVGLCIETMLLTIPAAAYLIYLGAKGTGSFLRGSMRIDLLLLGTSVLTAVPLTFFTAGARRINLSTVGLLQYIAPTGIFLLAVFYYQESFSKVQVFTFIMIWTALAIYSTDSVIYFRRTG
ncbi:MAG: EamA family transporter RarD [Desulfobacterales bacterium]|nr:MAG: EamA family transporter RarD [Desulfobacterales bacterium]